MESCDRYTKINPEELSEVCHFLNIKGSVDITKFFDYDKINKICQEAQEAFSKYGKRKDFISVNGGGTPRNMFTVSKNNIDLTGNNIKNFYESVEVREFLSSIAGESINIIAYENEKYVINVLRNGGDTHGWHFDDYSYALVVIVEAPPWGTGGCLEYIPNCNDGSHRANFDKFQHILTTHEIHKSWYSSGSIYLMRSLTTLHRVNPIEGNNMRMSVAMSYGISSDIVEDHNNIVDLYS